MQVYNEYVPSATSSDGSDVEIYSRLPAGEDLDLINGLLGPASSVLDLGAGAGRLADPLAELGHRVTAVDASAEMLAHVRHAAVVHARFDQLHLPDRFDVVLMAGSLVSYLDADVRRTALAAAARHLQPGGIAIIQWRSPHWFTMRTEGHHRMVSGDTVQTMTIHTNRDGVVVGEFGLEIGGRKWSQPFEFHFLAVDQLTAELEAVGLRLDTPDPETTEWLCASRDQTDPE